MKHFARRSSAEKVAELMRECVTPMFPSFSTAIHGSEGDGYWVLCRYDDSYSSHSEGIYTHDGISPTLRVFRAIYEAHQEAAKPL